MNRYENLKVLASTIHKAAMIADIDPKDIAIKLARSYWMGSVMDMPNNDGFAVYHPESNRDKFELCGITFYNDRTMPDWMKKDNKL